MRSGPESNLPPPATEGQPSLPRKNRRVALGVVLLIHLALLTAILLSRARRPAPPPHSVDMVLLQEKVPEKKITEQPSVGSDIAPPTIAPPPIAPPPVVDVVPDAIRAPSPPPAPAPGPGPGPGPAPTSTPTTAREGGRGQHAPEAV